MIEYSSSLEGLDPSDRIACGYISALEVRPEFRGRGIGTTLLNRMAERLDVYGVYLSCAPSMAEFYKSRGFTAVVGMSKRKNGRKEA